MYTVAILRQLDILVDLLFLLLIFRNWWLVPIERCRSLIGQLNKKIDFSYDNIANGLRLIAWGFFKKMVVADNLDPFIVSVYDSSSSQEGLTVVLASYVFANTAVL